MGKLSRGGRGAFWVATEVVNVVFFAAMGITNWGGGPDWVRALAWAAAGLGALSLFLTWLDWRIEETAVEVKVEIKPLDDPRVQRWDSQGGGSGSGR